MASLLHAAVAGVSPQVLGLVEVERYFDLGASMVDNSRLVSMPVMKTPMPSGVSRR